MITAVPLTVVTNATPTAVELLVSATNVTDAGQTLELEADIAVIGGVD